MRSSITNDKRRANKSYRGWWAVDDNSEANYVTSLGDVRDRRCIQGGSSEGEQSKSKGLPVHHREELEEVGEFVSTDSEEVLYTTNRPRVWDTAVSCAFKWLRRGASNLVIPPDSYLHSTILGEEVSKFPSLSQRDILRRSYMSVRNSTMRVLVAFMLPSIKIDAAPSVCETANF